jgi:hypothetical protein
LLFRRAQRREAMSPFGGKGTLIGRAPMSAYDPKRTWRLRAIGQIEDTQARVNETPSGWPWRFLQVAVEHGVKIEAFKFSLFGLLF